MKGGVGRGLSIGVLALSACVTVRPAPRDEAWLRDANQHGAAGEAHLVFVDGVEKTDQGVDLSIGPSDTRWKDATYGNLRTLPNSEMRRVSFVTSRGRGALEGAVIGFLVGGVGGGAFAAEVSDPMQTTEDRRSTRWQSALEASLYAAPVGALLGAAIGAIAGHRTAFVFHEPASH